MKVNAIQGYQTNVIKNTKNFTNNDAVNLLKKELAPSMPEKTVNKYVETMKNICKKLNIQFKDLPINKEHPGNLNSEQSKAVCEEVFKFVALG